MKPEEKSDFSGGGRASRIDEQYVSYPPYHWPHATTIGLPSHTMMLLRPPRLVLRCQGSACSAEKAVEAKHGSDSSKSTVQRFGAHRVAGTRQSEAPDKDVPPSQFCNIDGKGVVIVH